MIMGGWVYMMTNMRNGTIYTGVTSHLIQRVWQHREGLVPGFTKRYGLKTLIYFEHHETIRGAIQREHNVKHWKREWKVELFEEINPEWEDLWGQITQ